MMSFKVACLLLGVQLALAEVYNYGAGTVGAGNPIVANPGGVGGSWSPVSDLSTLFNTGSPSFGGGSSWTYQPSSWSFGGSTQGLFGSTPSWTTAPMSFTTQWASWNPVTQQANTGAVGQFSRQNGNCQGNYLGAVTQLTLDACAAACLGTPACAGFSFNLRSTYPQCILKNSACSNPDPTATFTFFSRNGFQPPQQYYPAYVPVGPPVAVPAYPNYPAYSGYPYSGYPYPSWRSHNHGPYWKSANVRQFKRPGSQYYELPANCSGPVLRGPYIVMLDTCADDCSAARTCTGFSYDNTTDSCILHTGICQSMKQSTQWTYFARGDAIGQQNTEQAAPAPAAYGSQPATPMFGGEGEAAISALENADPVPPQKPSYMMGRQQPFNQQAASRTSNFPYNVNPRELLSRFDQFPGNCPGNALGETLTLPLDECARMCLESYACAGFSFNFKVSRPEEFQCMLKTQSCDDPSDSPYRFFSRRALNSFANVRYRHSSN